MSATTRWFNPIRRKPCKFLFPVTSGGAFEIADIQGHITQQGTQYSGSGNLVIHLANQSGVATGDGYDTYPPIPISFTNWNVPDGQTVTSGTIDVSPGITLLRQCARSQGDHRSHSGPHLVPGGRGAGRSGRNDEPDPAPTIHCASRANCLFHGAE